MYHPNEWVMGEFSQADELAQERRIELLHVPTPSLEEYCSYKDHCDERMWVVIAKTNTDNKFGYTSVGQAKSTLTAIKPFV